MTDTSQAEVPPQTNGIQSDGLDEEERAKIRPVDIDQDVREMERRKRVEVIMNSRLFREELERIIETQMKDGTGPSGLLQQISDMVGVNKQAGNVFKNSSCVVPINDIRGIEAMGYAKGEKILRCKLAAVFRLIDLYGWTQGTNTLITARLNQDDEQFLVNAYGMLFHELTASSLIKIDMQGNVVEQGTTNFSVNIAAFSLHAAVHAARPDLKCIIHVHTPSVVAISALKHGLLPLSQESVVIGDVSTHPYLGGMLDAEEKDKLARNLGPNNKVLLLSNQGALCCGETIEEAFFNARNTVLASEAQLKLLPAGLDNLVLLNDEVKKKIYDAAHKAPESTPRPDQPSILEAKVERKWRVGGVEFEALMRMLDNAGFRTGYIYRHPLVKGDPPKPKNDVELPPAVSSLGYLLEEEELYRQGLWKKLEGGRKGHDRSRWLNSPNVYQKVEILETGTTDPKKITKWVTDGSPTHSSTPVKIESALQFVPKGTNPKEFKAKQKEIKEYRISQQKNAGPQSHILEGVTWEEARKMQDATVTQTGDQVVLMGAASKGIIQRGHQHNATVYKSPYAKNPFDCVTDEELDEYKKVVEKKHKGDFSFTDDTTDYSESEGLSSANINKRIGNLNIRSPTSETEEESRDEPQILRIETKQAPRPSQPEVVLSDVESPTDVFLRNERTASNNHKSLKEVLASKLPSNHYYRTNSHAGLPQGSYAVPNPKHYHIVHQKQIAKLMRPKLLTIASHNHFNYNPRIFTMPGRSTPRITLNFRDSRSVFLDMSFQTLQAFIVPFVNALNLHGMPNNIVHQASQTSYVSELVGVESNTNSDFSSESSENVSSFERYILESLKDKLVSDLKTETSTSFDSAIVESSSTRETYSSINTRFDEDDEIVANESCVELTPDVLSIMPQSDTSGSADDSETNLLQELPFYECDDSIKQCLTVLADKVSNEIIKLSSDFKAVSGVIDFAKSMIQSPDDTFETASEQLTDEGINDCSFDRKSTAPYIPSANVIEMSKIILDYLVEQCFEIKELILFPEVLHDESLNKLLAKLKHFYDSVYGDTCSDEDKNELRIHICSHVLKLLEVDEKINGSPDTSLNIISDKLFSISEFLSDILDLFFNCINKDNSVLIVDENGDHVLNLTQNQPSSDEIFNSTMNNNNNQETFVTSFKKDFESKNGSEAYWFSISNTPILDATKVEATIVNVDDIPLKPPTICLDSTLNRTLSPILEEPMPNNLGWTMTSIIDFDDSNDETSSAELEKITIENTLMNESYVHPSVKRNLFNSSGCDLIEDQVVYDNCSDSYVAVEDSDNEEGNERNFIEDDAKSCKHIFKDLTIQRINVYNLPPFTYKKKVTFRTDLEDDSEKENDEGNWMGFESAKF